MINNGLRMVSSDVLHDGTPFSGYVLQKLEMPDKWVLAAKLSKP